LRPSYKRCSTYAVDYSAKFEAEKHSFSGSASEKSDLKAFEISYSPQVDFIPLDILSEFPELNGFGFFESNLPTLKSGLFKKELQKIEFLYLGYNKIEVIEAEAFQYLIKLKWIRLTNNKLTSLPHQLFKNNPDLILIGLGDNKFNAIHPSFFDGLQKLKLIDFQGNLCIQSEIGCETCQITQSDLNEKLRDCFENCQKDTICHNSHSAQEASESPKVIPELTEIKLILEGIDKKLLSMTENLRVALTSKIESENEAIKNKIEETNKLNHEILEKLNEILAGKINCGLENANELQAAQLENEKLKVKVLKAELGQKKMEKELKNLKLQSKQNLKE
jgi:Leucine-rich repeat (LRR) protein